MKTNNYFLLFSNCIPVKGAGRSTICDLQKGTYVFIPNTLFSLIQDFETCTIGDLLKKHKSLTKHTLKEYIEYLMSYDLGHYATSPNNFPKINDKTISPHKINDSIIELSVHNYKNAEYIIKSLSNLGCQNIELRSYDIFSLSKLAKLLDFLKSSTIRNAEIYIKYDSSYNVHNYMELCYNYQVVSSIIIHSCPEDKASQNSDHIFHTTQQITSSSCCGQISKEHFNVNLKFYLESIRFNTCLNKKISITAQGNIKNCPSLEKSFGNIKSTSLENAYKQDDFKSLWNISKDKIEVCKECEFRHICSDCRAYVKDSFEKPKSCKYNPYTMSYEI